MERERTRVCTPGISQAIAVFSALLLGGVFPAVAEGEPSWKQGPIPIRFSLEKPSFVTLVIEDAAGRRVRNLLAEEQFPAGEHTVYWDGADVHLHKSNGTL